MSVIRSAWGITYQTNCFLGDCVLQLQWHKLPILFFYSKFFLNLVTETTQLSCAHKARSSSPYFYVRQCPYVFEAITALAEMGLSAKEFSLLFSQVSVCSVGLICKRKLWGQISLTSHARIQDFCIHCQMSLVANFIVCLSYQSLFMLYVLSRFTKKKEKKIL